jgi:hypothetical protein
MPTNAHRLPALVRNRELDKKIKKSPCTAPQIPCHKQKDIEQGLAPNKTSFQQLNKKRRENKINK